MNTRVHVINGHSYTFGPFTIGMGIEIERYLATIPSKFKVLQGSGGLDLLSKEKADELVAESLQSYATWPPDAYAVLQSDLHTADFANAVMKSALRQYNRGLTSDQIDQIAGETTRAMYNAVVVTILGLDGVTLDEPDPKVAAGDTAVNPDHSQSNEKTGIGTPQSL